MDMPLHQQTPKTNAHKTDIFTRLESEVRSYCRSFPTVFTAAKGALLKDASGREYVDFFAGAGALNYGHNNPALKRRLIDYLAGDGVTHSLDMFTMAKAELLERFEEVILAPRELSYRAMFPGPTGTNAVEAALKLARKVTGRPTVVSFTNGFHGMTLGSLAATGNQGKRDGAGVALDHVHRMPFDGYLGAGINTIEVVERMLEDRSSGVPLPAAFLLETVQAEGGVNVASMPWLRELRRLADRFNALLIVDDIQVGCGRTGPFFSFEPAGITPDVVCLSKSLSGYGLPLAMVLLRPELDVWAPGEHNGTFRGHNPAFVTATAALEYWRDDALQGAVAAKAETIAEALRGLAGEYGGEQRGRGMIQGVAFDDPEFAGAISKAAFERGLIVETAGPKDEVLKLLPPLTIKAAHLQRGLEILGESARAAAESRRPVAPRLRPRADEAAAMIEVAP
jgi:diaminobutyrate-2-oxoglutarate transaminase